MIETQILGSAVGVQRGDVIDNSETTTLPSLGNGVITGKFKRGRTDKPFKVTSDNFRALLGHEPNNPSYMAVEDAFKRGISEVQVLRVGSSSSSSGSGGSTGGGGSGGGNPIQCIPTATTMTMTIDPSVTPPSVVTIAVNNNPAKTLSIYTDEEELALSLFLAPDGTSFAFLGSTGFGIVPREDGTKAIIDIAGLSIDGVTFNETLYDPRGGFSIFDGQQRVYATDIVPEVNTVVITRTPNTQPSDDMYYMYGGNETGNPIVLSSCAKAVMPITTTCTPKSAAFRDDDYYPDFTQISSVHARYRVNDGAWINYTDNPNVYSTQESLIKAFLQSIQDIDGNKLFATSYDPEGLSTPFYCPEGAYGVYSGTTMDNPSVSFTQRYFDKLMSTKIDFEATANESADLVNVMFDGSQSVSSCALAFWAYR